MTVRQQLKTPFADLQPPLSTEEYDALKADIAANGVRDPVIVDEDDNVLDGHNRHRICDELGIDVPIRVITGLTDAEKQAFVFQSNNIRRNLSPDQKREQREKMQALARRLREEDPTKNTQQRIALLLGVSQPTVSAWLQSDTTNISADNGCIPDARVIISPASHATIVDRVDAGESQAQVAADHGVSQQQISNIVRRHQKRREAALSQNPPADDPRYTIHQGDALAVLRTMADESVHCVVTSPPYWGLRDYGTGTWVGGDADCDHTVSLGDNDNMKLHVDRPFRGDRSQCLKCGASRIDNQLGLENDPAEYVDKIVDVFREVRRVLRNDGTVWLNLGDGYNAQTGKGFPGTGQVNLDDASKETKRQRPDWLKPKDLVGIPWMVAFALRAEGWYLRQDIIWNKPNPMPESCQDRCTKAHEYLFLLTKSARYHYDAEAIRELAAYAGQSRGGSTNRYEQNNAGMDCVEYDTRNKRSVWTICPESFPEAHFATFPQKLVEPCILAGCPAGGTVLDPFAGAGTTLLVALNHGRHGVGIELNADYIDMSKRRIAERSGHKQSGGATKRKPKKAST